MAEAYIVEAVRTPVGRRGGGLGRIHPADLGARVLKELVARTGVDPAAVEDVVFGCLDAVGPQAGDIARTSWLAAGLPEEVPGTTVDRQCGSSQQAVHFAAQAPFAAPDGRTDRFDDVGLGHGNSPDSPVGYVRTAIPSSTIDRYCRAISSGLCCPPGRYQDAATHTVSRTNR